MKIGSSFMTAPVQKSPDEKLKDVSEMYEKHFLREMLKSMRSTVHEGGFIKASQGEKIFRDQLDDQYVDKWSDKGGIGLSKLIYTQLVEKFGAQLGIKNPVEKPHGPLPLNEKSDFTGSTFNSSGKKENFSIRFDRVALEKPELGNKTTEVKAPWAGILLNKVALNPDESLLEIAHDNGLKSRLVFKGALSKLSTGQNLQEGEVLGLLSPEAKSLFWNVQTGPQEKDSVSE
jgi:flagellar protein FlgJ